MGEGGGGPGGAGWSTHARHGYSHLVFYIYKRLHPSKKIRNRKKERATETLNLNTKPLKSKCRLGDGGGGGGLVDPCKAWVPPPSLL